MVTAWTIAKAIYAELAAAETLMQKKAEDHIQVSALMHLCHADALAKLLRQNHPELNINTSIRENRAKLWLLWEKRGGLTHALDN